MHTYSSVEPPPARTVVRDNTRGGVLLLVGLLTVVVLVLTAGSQIYDPESGMFIAEGRWEPLGGDVAPGETREITLTPKTDALSEGSETVGWNAIE